MTQSSPALLVLLVATSASAATGSAVCGACHASIYRSYMSTPMAVSSGLVNSGVFREKFERNTFSHSPSGVRYRVNGSGNPITFDFELRDGNSLVRGSRKLEYFIGSGRVGRSYLFSIDGFLYQAPVSYYSAAARWDLSPGYQSYEHLYLTRPIEPACLQCHTSQVRPAEGTLNGYEARPFAEGGVACERCHGDGERHVARMRSGNLQGGYDITNPQKLLPENRDSVCAQCHLAGVARIRKTGSAPFRPGDRLSDSLSVFLWSGSTAEMKVTSHFEKLAQSVCKIKSDDRLWCGSCHDPHAVPPQSQVASYFRAKCTECHGGDSGCKAPATLRAGRSNDCVACHMPKSPVTDVAHAVYTDHSIPRRPAASPRQNAASERSLVLFDGRPASRRDLGLAYASLLESEPNPAYATKALELLKAADIENPNDVAVLVQLGTLYGLHSDDERAMDSYARALRLDRSQVVASNNLAVYHMKRGETDQAIALWSDVLTRSPGFEDARMNLAMAQIRAGSPSAARATLEKGLALNPGSTVMRRAWTELGSRGR